LQETCLSTDPAKSGGQGEIGDIVGGLEPSGLLREIAPADAGSAGLADVC
jgi:hypothetical protein